MSNPANAATQHAFIASTHYDPAVRRIASNTGFNVSSRPTVVQDVVWSTAVQHGSAGAANIVGRVLHEQDLIRQMKHLSEVYMQSVVLAMVPDISASSTSSVRNAVVSRFRREESDALARLRAGGN
jgi:hypothetical protein